MNCCMAETQGTAQPVGPSQSRGLLIYMYTHCFTIGTWSSGMQTLKSMHIHHAPSWTVWLDRASHEGHSEWMALLALIKWQNPEQAAKAAEQAARGTEMQEAKDSPNTQMKYAA